METHLESGTTVPMQVVGRVEIADGIFELTLRHDGFHFEPGECVVIFGPEGVSRPYSVASSPAEHGVLRILYRRMPDGLLTGWLCERQPGDSMMVSYAFGDFRPNAETRSQEHSPVFIATGVGIAPFLSTVRDGRIHASRPRCLYGVRHLADVVDRELLGRCCELQLAVSREKVDGVHHGHVDALVQALDVNLPRDYFLCGLDTMVYAQSDWLEAQGVPAERVHTEVFFTAS